MIRADGAARHLGVFEAWRLIFLMVERTSRPQSPSIMGTSKEEKMKMTKQGVRDLNHQVPKKRPVEVEGTAGLVDQATPVVAASVVTAPLEP
jgi:hypothetical protein